MHFALTSFLIALAMLTAAIPQLPEDEAGSFSIPIFKRSSLVNEDKTVNVEALHAQVASTRAKILRGLNNFKRSTGASHPSALEEAQKRDFYFPDVYLLRLTDYQDTLWYGSIEVGTPSKSFTVYFDTASSDFYLPGPECGSCDGHMIYDPKASRTSSRSKLVYNNGDDDDDVVIAWYTDTVVLCGLTVEGQPLLITSEYYPSLLPSYIPPDGVLGLAFQPLSFTNIPTFLDRIRTKRQKFSFKLTQSGAELSIGGVNRSLINGYITYTPVTQWGFWQVNMDGIENNGQTIMSNVESIIDTATSVIIGIPSAVQNLMNSLGGLPAPPSVGSGYYTFPCDDFPSISFTFGGTSFPLLKSALNLGAVSPGSSDCLCGIVGQNIGASFWVIGDIFLQGVYTTLRGYRGEPQVGFGVLA